MLLRPIRNDSVNCCIVLWELHSSARQLSGPHVATTRGAPVCERVWKACENLISCLDPSSPKKTCNCQHWKWPWGVGGGDTWEASDVRPHVTVENTWLFLNFWITPAPFQCKILQTSKSLNCWALSFDGSYFFKSAPPPLIVTFQFLNQLGSVIYLPWLKITCLRKQTLTSCSLKACLVTPVSTCVWGCKYDQLCACKKIMKHMRRTLIAPPYGFTLTCKAVLY